MCGFGAVPRNEGVDHGGRHPLPVSDSVSAIQLYKRCHHSLLHHGDGHPPHHPGPVWRSPRGRSWKTHLSSLRSGSSAGVSESSVHGETSHVHGWELFGDRAIREGKWKAIWMKAPKGRNDWELYDIEDDPAEMHDLSQKEPDVLKRLLDHWLVYFAETGMVILPSDFPNRWK